MTSNPGRGAGSKDIITELKKINANFSQIDVDFVNDEFGIDINQDFQFTGTPEIIHNGEDSTEWTTSQTGSGFTFNSADHAKQARIEVLDFSALSGVTVTITVSGTTTVLTEGVDWTAATDNPTTASSLNTALLTVENISTILDSNAIIIQVDNNFDITSLGTNASQANLLTRARSIRLLDAETGDTAIFTAPSPIDMSTRTALSASVFVTQWSANGNKDLIFSFRNNGTQVGKSVKLSNFIPVYDFNTWLNFVLPKAAFGITTETINELTITVESTGSGLAPDVYLDMMQIEENGVPLEFVVNPQFLGQPIDGFLTSIKYTIEGPVTSVLSGATSPTIPFDSFLGIPELYNGVVFQFTRDFGGGSVPLFGLTFKNLRDIIDDASATVDDRGTSLDGTTTWVTIFINFREPLPFNGTTQDQIKLIVNDPLSGLKSFTAKAVITFQETF